MALGITALGQVDPSRIVMDGSGTGTNSPPIDLAFRWADISFLTSDYSSGLAMTASTLGFSTILGVTGGALRSSGGTIKKLLAIWDVGTNKVRLLQDTAGTGTFADGVGGVHFADSDIVRIGFVGV